MRKLKLSAMSGGSLVPRSVVADMWGVSPRTVDYVAGGSGFLQAYTQQEGKVSEVLPSSERIWRLYKLEDAVFLEAFFGGRGRGKSWGFKRGWDHRTPEQFEAFKAAMQAAGWEACYLGEGGWRLVLRAGCTSEAVTAEIYPA